MCGIAGVLDRSGAPVSPLALAAMGDAVAHRGPDDSGVWVTGPVGLANRRLAILDLDPRGRMPMSKGHFHITYNGEVYNFRELRTELVRLGHDFHTDTDTEVVLAAYAEWGAAGVERFNGMFAFAIWDASAGELFLARDRYGIKPLYLAEVGSQFLFASEIKSLLVHGSVRAELSAPHLVEYFTFQNILSDGTLFKGVRLLPAGCHVTVPASGGVARQRRYWDFAFVEPAHACSDEEYLDELDRLFRKAVTRQLVADVPVGAHLSGGMDSGAITAIAATALPWLPTFTVGFDIRSSKGLEFGRDERQKAEAMSYEFQTEHFQVVLKAGDMERCLPSLVWHLEDLRVGQSYPNFYLARLASRFVKVAMSGTGGDELFAGYPWRYYRAVVNRDVGNYVEKYYSFWHRLVPNELMPTFFSPEVWREGADVDTVQLFRNALPSDHSPECAEDYVNSSLYLEAKTFLHGLLLVEDKLSMAHSLESRVPFLDNDLVDFAMQLPVRLKLRDLDRVVALNENEPGDKTRRYFERTRDGKLLLRRALRRYASEDVSDQVKQGFTGPDATWFRGESMEYVKREVLNRDAAMYEFLSPDGVFPLVNEHLEGRTNRRLLLWSLLSFENWCRIFLAGQADPDALAINAAAPLAP